MNKQIELSLLRGPAGIFGIGLSLNGMTEDDARRAYDVIERMLSSKQLQLSIENSDERLTFDIGGKVTQ